MKRSRRELDLVWLGPFYLGATPTLGGATFARLASVTRLPPTFHVHTHGDINSYKQMASPVFKKLFEKCFFLVFG